LRNKLDELEIHRNRLVDSGLLEKDEGQNLPIRSQDIDERTRNVLAVYVGDVEKKLDVFGDIADKIDLFRRIVNSKFSYKEIVISREKGFIFRSKYPEGSEHSVSDFLSPSSLSSGEQHELVLLYELLFKVKENSLVLIDEPELSLHVGWQVNFLKDLQEITKLADLDLLIATHSPSLINDRWDLTVELKGAA
jgi:predicted ATP-binding protein involved in virulence